MKFGRTDDRSGIQTALPTEPDNSRFKTLKTRSNSSNTLAKDRLIFGAPMWGNRSWIGKVYPKDTKLKDLLRAYSAKFPAVELNSTFYGVPGPKTIAKWKEESADGFLFSPKLFEGISHRQFSDQTVYWIRQYFQAMSGLGEKLGMCFIQFHESFSPAHLTSLSKILAAIPNPQNLAVEFRHPAWFYKNDLIPAAIDALSSVRASTVITDTSGRRDVLHLRLTSSTAFIRFTGNNLHSSDLDRMDRWMDQIQTWLEEGLERVYIYLHEPNEDFVPPLAEYFVQGMNRRMNLGLQSWREREFHSEPQMNLF